MSNFIKDIENWNDTALVAKGPDATELALDLVSEEFVEFLEAETPAEKLKELVDVIWVLVGYARAAGLPLEAALAEVSDSNWSKFLDDNFAEGDAEKIDAELDLFKEQGIDAKAVMFMGKVSFKNEAGKIIKPSTYRKANITKLLEER